MRLNTKIGLILGVPILLVVAALGAVLQSVLMERFAELERRELAQNHERLRHALDAEFSELERLAVDWAVWDDTYHFMQGRNPDWLVVNFTPATFDNLQLDGLLIFDAEHRLHIDYTYDVAAQQFVKQSPLLIERLAHAFAARAGATDAEHHGHGIIEFDGRVLQLGFSAILDSNAEGDPLGTLVMMRYIGANRVEQLAERIRLTLSFYPLGEQPSGSAAASAARALLAGGRAPYVEADGDTIRAISMLADLNGVPTLLMQMQMPRDVLAQGRRTVTQLFAFALGSMVLLGAGMFIAIRQVVLKRLSRIGRTLLSIGSGGATQERLPVVGDDEIDRLARSINAMLDGLDHAYAARRQSAERQRELNGLLVRIATDEGLARGDEEALFRVLSGSLGAGARLDRWSLWLRAPGQTEPTCWRISGHAGDAGLPPAELIAEHLEHWDGAEGVAIRLGNDAPGLARHAVLLPFAVEQWRGALLVESVDAASSWAEDEINFLLSATTLVERSLSAHFRHLREQALRRQAEADPLTGLANRATFERALRSALGAAARGRPHRVAVLFIDLDCFKPVNDQHGHAVGDWLLRQVADRLRRSLRDHDLIARLGGDEFTVLIDHPRSDGVAGRIAAKLVDAIAEPYRHDDTELRVGCSIGVACAPTHGTDFDTLLRAADLAMYAAKQAGRNTWRMSPVARVPA